MKRLAGLVFALLLLASVALAYPGIQARTEGRSRVNGFIPYYWDAQKGEILFELSPAALGHEFLYFTGLGSGTGSLEVFADRSSVGDSDVCRFRRVGPRVLVIQQNMNFRAPEGSAALQNSVRQSFPTSILAALPIEAEDHGTLLVDANPLLVRDAFDLMTQLRTPMQVVNGEIVPQTTNPPHWALDLSRSTIDPEHTRNFPLNTETEAILTFTSDSSHGLPVPDGHALSIREHQSFVALPAPGYQPRDFDPRVGYFRTDFEDFSRAYNLPWRRHWIDRWRLIKKDPNAAVSESVQPIVFYLDPAIPEPIRSAIRRGVLWWNHAFEQAGFRHAIAVRDLPPGIDPLDMRYNTIQWTNRTGRGWSVGMTQVDPRTGEILHAVVQLDSYRMRTMAHYWQALEKAAPTGIAHDGDLNLFAPLDGLDPQTSEEQVMLNRLALLACHEVGHALGLEHNFIASTFRRGSVMDYYAPRVTIRRDGTPDLSDAYMQDVGSYDRFAIEWGYSEGRPGATAAQEQARLNGIVRQALAEGIVWGNPQDARWSSYDDGPDPVTWLREVLPVRNALLARYGAAMLRPGQPVADFSSRFALVYLFHRYALEAAMKVVGGAEVPPALSGDGQTPVRIWPAAGQREALQLGLSALTPANLAVPDRLWRLLAPPVAGTDDAERYVSSAGPLFSPYDGARSIADIVYGTLLQPQRLERVEAIHLEDPSALTARQILDSLIGGAFSTPVNGNAAQLQGVAQTDLAERLMRLAVDRNATPEVQAQAWVGLAEVDLQLANALRRQPENGLLLRLSKELQLFKANPQRNIPTLTPSGVPPGPPV